MAKLTRKQKRFVDEYLIDLNATQAAIRAGYSINTAKEIGYENLTKPHIQQRIQRQMKERARRTELSQDNVVQELKKIAFSNILDYLKIENNKIQFFDSNEMKPGATSVIAEVKEYSSGISIKLYDKLKALELLGKHLGMFTGELNLSGNISIGSFDEFTTDELKVIIQKL